MTRIKNKMLFGGLLLNIGLIAGVIFLMSNVQRLLYSDVQINLTEIVTQNKDVIASKLMLEVNNLDLAAEQISIDLKQAGRVDLETLHDVIVRYTERVGDSEIYISDTQGTAFFASGQQLSIAGRKYFTLAMAGEHTVSERLISRTTGKEIFVISAPLELDGAIVGTVQRSYSPEEMYALCSVSLFSDKGHMHVINREGNIQISSEGFDCNLESENYYRSILAQGNQQAAAQLEADIQAGRAGFMETMVAGEKIFSAYTPIEELHDWFLITSIATGAVSPNANMVIRLFYVILLLIIVIFIASLCYFFRYKNKQQTVLAHIAFVDEITKGNTLSKFVIDLTQRLKTEPDTQFTLISFDIDNFKYVNSYYGFDTGDKILRHIYTSIHATLLPGETMARITDDRFVVLANDTSPPRLQSLIPAQFTVDGVAVYLSAGMYAITDPQESISLMIDKASTAAQSIKGVLHKVVVPYSEEFDQTVAHNEQIKREVALALTKGDIIPFFQPKIDIHSGELVGAEALARWMRRDGTMISPADFIPLCEKTGQIVDLDLAIFRQVLVFLKKNLENGVPCVPISVNFSRLHLLNKEFIHVITQRLEAHGVPAYYIEIELTESVIFENHEAIIDFANHLHEHGLRISMDDFGSGYSSLNLLKDIPIDALKIDKGFLDDTANLDRRQIILSAIVNMANALNTAVVVEGVETKENVAMMKDLGCTIAQGYFFARPMNEATFQGVFEKGRVL